MTKAKKTKLLLVDDDHSVSDMLLQRFERDGHEVCIAKDGVEGLTKLEEFRPDIIVTDIVMPNKSGTEMIADIQKIHPEVKIVAISGGGRMGVDLMQASESSMNSEEQNKILQLLDTSEEKGAILSLQKPIDPPDLSLAVSLLLTEPSKRKEMVNANKDSEGVKQNQE